jgi:hypothetical protein
MSKNESDNKIRPRVVITPGGFFKPTIKPPIVTTDLNTKKKQNPGVPIIAPDISGKRNRYSNPNPNALGPEPPLQTKGYRLQKGTRVWIRRPPIFDEADYNIIPESTFEKIIYGEKYFSKPVYYYGPSKYKGFSIFTTHRNSLRGSKILTTFLIPVENNPTIISKAIKHVHSIDDGSDFRDDESDNDDIPDYEVNVNVNRDFNLVFDMLDPNHGYAARIGSEDDCFIEYELNRRVLNIHYFICEKGGKQLLDDLLNALTSQDHKINQVKLTAAGLDRVKQEQGKTDEDLFSNYIAMGFTRFGETGFMGSLDDILNAHEDRAVGIKPQLPKAFEDLKEYKQLHRELNPEDRAVGIKPQPPKAFEDLEELNPEDYYSELDDYDSQLDDSQPEIINPEPEPSTEQEVNDFIRTRFTKPISEIIIDKDEAYRSGIPKKQCYIRFEVLYEKLEIKAFICEKAGKELLRDTMIQLLLQNKFFGLVWLNAVNLRRKPVITPANYQDFINKEYIDEELKFTQHYDDKMQELVNTTYKSMGFFETTKDHFVGSTLGILNTLLAFKRPPIPGGSKKTKTNKTKTKTNKTKTNKTKRRQKQTKKTKKTKQRKTKRKQKKNKRRQTKKGGKDKFVSL